MEPEKNVRDRLLERLPEPANLGNYRQEVGALLAKNQKDIRRERKIQTAVWIFCVISAVAFMWFDGSPVKTPKGPWLACFMFLWGMTEWLRHHINSARVDVLKEIKQVQLQVLELQKSMR